MPLIEAVGLTKAYGYLPALRALDVSIERGESIALLGPNGGGKSTLLRLLAGLSRPTGGRLTVGGWSLPAEADAVRAQIGMVGHRPMLYDGLTAAENLDFFGCMYGLPADARRTRAGELLERVGLAARAAMPVRTFSRGMQQRLSIARALLHDPEILLLDEPHTGLDRTAGLLLDELLLEARQRGRTLIMATHELDRPERLASRVLFLSRGRLLLDAPMASMDHAALAALFAPGGAA